MRQEDLGVAEQGILREEHMVQQVDIQVEEPYIYKGVLDSFSNQVMV
jgi:hypothetical protein